jgi:hypothetical protein
MDLLRAGEKATPRAVSRIAALDPTLHSDPTGRARRGSTVGPSTTDRKNAVAVAD